MHEKNNLCKQEFYIMHETINISRKNNMAHKKKKIKRNSNSFQQNKKNHKI